MPWGAAIALGAIVAPSDAAAATTVLKQLRPPHRILVILEGESLFNDASALLVYKLAVTATITGSVSGWTVAPTMLFVSVGSVVLALGLARLTLAVMARIDDVATSVIFQFCSAFGVWIIAEHLHLSGIITTVVFAMIASRRAPEIMPARMRIQSWAVWEVAVFVLNVLAFTLVGLQLKSLMPRIPAATGAWYAIVASAAVMSVLLARIIWVTVAAALMRWLRGRHSDGLSSSRYGVQLSSRAAAVLGWCGMRGTVTLAAALALPSGSATVPAFPYRDLILIAAFAVVLGTLVIQGLTLKPLLKRLRLEDDGAVDREVRLARLESLKAGLAASSACPGEGTAALVRHSYELRLRNAEAAIALDSDVSPGQLKAFQAAAISGDQCGKNAVRAGLQAQRSKLIELRSGGTIGDAAFQRLEEELDWTELGWTQLLSEDP